MRATTLIVALCAGLLFSPGHAEDGESLPPCSERILVPAKPKLADYPVYDDFVVDIMDYKSAQRRQAAHSQVCPDTYDRTAQVGSGDPHVIDGPETLQEALARSEQLEPLDYEQHPTWHDRSTSRTFALPDLPSDQLASERIRSLVDNLSSDNPLQLPLSWLSLQNEEIDNGIYAERLPSLQQYVTLTDKEQDILAIMLEAQEGTGESFTEILFSSGFLLFLGDDDEIRTVNGFIEVESCLSSGCPDQQ